MNAYPTPHINAVLGDFAKTVLMPGDPVRADFIAQNFLSDARIVTEVRGIRGYTGLYRGVPVSVMASGMGIPSIGIYSHELYHVYGVESIIRVGSAQGLHEHIRVRDIVMGMGACTNSSYGDKFHLAGKFAPICDHTLLCAATQAADGLDLGYHVGNLFSTDNFYFESNAESLGFARMGVLAVEMEAAGLYMNAAAAGKRALAICTISDHILSPESLTSEERATGFFYMVRIALDTAVRMDGVTA